MNAFRDRTIRCSGVLGIVLCSSVLGCGSWLPTLNSSGGEAGESSQTGSRPATGKMGSASGDSTEVVEFRVLVKTHPETNSGNVLNMMFRCLDAKASVDEETYENAVAMAAAASQRSSSESRVEALIPGYNRELSFRCAKGERLVAYFLFTDPGSNWRVALQSTPSNQVRIDLGANEVEWIEPPVGQAGNG